MKCSYCGNELEKGADFCPGCGMILGLNEVARDKKTEAEELEFKVPEYTPNVFKAIDVEEEADIPAMELEGSSEEETVPVTENIPEYVSQVPEYVPSEHEDISSGDSFEDETDVQKAAEEIDEESVNEEAVQEIAVEKDFSEEELSAPEYVPAPDVSAEDGFEVKIPEQIIAVPEYEEFENIPVDDNPVPDDKEDEEEDDDDDFYVDQGKKKNGVLAVFLVIAVICVLIGGVYAVKNVIPTVGKEQTTTEDLQLSDASDKETTEAEEDTTDGEEDTTEAEDDTTEAEDDTTLEGVSGEGDEEDEESTTVSSTTAPVAGDYSTTKSYSDGYYTTKHYTTTKQYTTKPYTTKPATTKPSATKPITTTDPYGINDVTVKKPSKLNSKTYTVYCTAEGVILRNAPSKSSDRVLYLSKGADLTVYGEENGYYYVRSNRYGVYGWVSGSYTSDGRPEAETTKVYKNTVTPDKKYDDVKVKYTTSGLNLRKGPGKDYAVVTLIPQNYPVKVIGYKSGVSGWAYVTDTTYGYSGWVSTAYLK